MTTRSRFMNALPLTPSRSRHAFTLFEVSISLVLVAFGVVSVLMLFPTGLKAQQMARLQILAATKAEEMIDAFTSTQASNPAVDTEGIMMWDVPSSYRSLSWDLEARLSSHRFGLMPLPLDIAKRLDSAGGELEQIVAQGGYLYYSQPMATSNLQEQGQSAAPPNEAQRLVIGIAGYAQQNALHILPAKNWPYHTPWPSPPLTMGHMADPFLPTRTYGPNDLWSYYVWPWSDQWRTGKNSWNDNEVFCVPWETTPVNASVNPQGAAAYHDDDIQKVYHWRETVTDEAVGYFPYACGRNWLWNDPSAAAGYARDRAFMPVQLQPTGTDQVKFGKYPSRTSALKYMATALWYAKKKFNNDEAPFSNPALPVYGPFRGEEANPGRRTANEKDFWKEVQAMRFLAHAATCLTGWYGYTKSGTDTEDLSTGVKIPVINLSGVGASHSSSDFKITHKLIRYYHERSLYLINTFASRYPYDWSVPRPLNRVCMMDFPLLQADLFSPPQPVDMADNDLYRHRYKSGNDNNHTMLKIFGRSAADYPQQWRPLAPEPIRNFGVGATYPTHRVNADQPKSAYGPYFGDHRDYNLTAPFLAAERCREIVMWAVDWQAYEDCETAKCAPIDASKYPLSGPRGNWKGWGGDHGWVYPQTNGNPDPTPWTNDFSGRMNDVEFRDEQLWAFRNPEKVIMFKSSVANLVTGSNVESMMVLNDGGVPDRGPGTGSREIFNGIFGSDRNFNRKLDRGHVPRSVRMRATSVARFNFYDPRAQATLR